MSMKIGKKIGAVLLGSALLMTSSPLGAVTPPDFTVGRDLQILFNAFRDVNLYYVDSVDTERMLTDAAQGMTKNLDPYTELIPEKEMADFAIQTTGKYGGIGALIRKSGDYVMIAQPYRGFPADKAGLVIGDRIVSIEGESIQGYDATKVSGMLKGTPGTTVHLTVKKLLTDTTQEVSMRRERIVISGVPYYGMLADSVGYILHSDFSEDCSSDMRRAVEALRQAGAKSLVIDLRGNGGGILQEAVNIVSLFVPKGTEVVSMRGRMKDSQATFTTQNEPIDTKIPLVILVDRMTASAAEIVSGALQDLDRAVLIGQRTFGKGLVQTTRPVGYNAFLKVTTAKYYIPSGRCIQAIDYTHRNEDGSVGTVPDSLVREYKTAAGRKVYDGGGIMPDVKIEPDYTGVFTVALYGKGYIEDFANDYYKRHREAVDVDHFTLSDEEFARFIAFVGDQPLDYESESMEAVKQLEKRAAKEHYDSLIAPEIESLHAKLKADRAAEFQRSRKDISKLLEDEIVMRYHYDTGVTRHSSHRDPEIARAVEMLRDRAGYEHIVQSQDTARK